MERTTFLKNYRIRLQYDGTPHEPAKAGSVSTYAAVDQRTAEPVTVTLIPTEAVDAAERDGFEDRLASAQKLHHANIAKVLDFGREDDDYVYVSERLGGETLASWVRSHGPMPADAALRVGEQIVSVLSSASFHKVPYPPIQPSDVMLVPGQTAEGTWPFVKVTNFGLPELKPGTAPRPIESDLSGKAANQNDVNDKQFAAPTTDVASEIYSLGVTLYFLLSGVVLSADALQVGPKFTGFPKPLRALLGKLLHRNPDQRPKDLLVATEMIRESLGKIERRRALSDRYGIPLRTSVPPPRKARPRLLLRTAVVLGVLLLLAAAIAPFVFPDAIGNLVRDFQKPKQIGVLVGVPDSSPATSQSLAVAQLPHPNAASPPAVVSPQTANSAALPETPAPANAISPNPFHVSPADVQQAQMANAQPQSAGPTHPAESPIATAPDGSVPADTTANSAQAKAESSPAAGSQSSSPNIEKSVASKSKRAHARSSAAYSPQGRTRSMRSRVTGITPDGRLILRLPSGRTAIVAPDEDASMRRHRNRVYMDRDQTFGPPPGFAPEYSPDD